jgi:hypothetical protein
MSGKVSHVPKHFLFTLSATESKPKLTPNSLGLPSLLRPLRLPLVQLQPNHDLRSDAPRQRVPLLQPVQHHRQGLVVHRPVSLFGYHRCQRFEEQQHAVLLPFCAEFGELLVLAVFRRSGEESG